MYDVIIFNGCEFYGLRIQVRTNTEECWGSLNGRQVRGIRLHDENLGCC